MSLAERHSSRPLLAGLFLLIAAPACAQITGAVIHGAVTDPQNAAVAGVEITVINRDTGISVTTRTNQAGVYELPALNPGTYELVGRMAGFSAHRRSGIELGLQQRLRVDFALQLAGVAEMIEVQGSPSVLETETARISHPIEGRVISNLPFRGNNMLMVTRLVPGANITAPADTFAASFDTFSPSNVSFNGAPVHGNSILTDGIVNQYGTGAMGFTPSTEAVREVNIQSFALSAEYGQTGGAVISVETKSGTNRPHGTLYWYHNNAALNANDFFSNRAGRRRGGQVMNQLGANVGGPVYIPGIYNGRNRTFFFFNYEEYHRKFARTATNSVPGPRERTGDFSQTRTANGQLIQIYNPFTTRFDAGVLIRDPFVNNIIPSQMISSIARNVLRYVPEPNLPGLANNYFFPFGSVNNSNSEQARVDHQFGQRNTLFTTFGRVKRTESNPSTYPTGVTGWFMPDSKTLWAIGDTHVFGPNTILNVRAGFEYSSNINQPRTSAGEREALGFSAAFLSLLRAPAADFTSFSVADMTGFGNNTAKSNFITPDARVYVTRLADRHSLNVGYEYRAFRAWVRNSSGEAGSFSFNRDWTQGPRAATSSANAGFGTATLLLGTPSGGSVSINANTAGQTQYHAFYIQDNWRITRQFTLNLGFRYDYETPITERFDRLNRGFAFDQPSPIASQAEANYARNPIPEVSNFKVRGGLLFAGVNDQPRYSFDEDRRAWMPRIGFAWQPGNRTVLRGGYGRFYLPLRDIRGSGVSQGNLPLSQVGFSSSTSMQASFNNLPFNTLSNPFPQGLVEPIGATLGLSTLLGQSITFLDTEARRAASDQFDFSIQREIAHQIRLEVAYIGSRMDRLPVDEALNGTPPALLSLRDELNRAVPNPFAGLIAVGTLSQATVAKSQLVRTYPHFSGVTQAFRPIGKTWYDSLQASANKRFGRGLAFQVSYTLSKQMQELGFLSFGLPLEHVISPLDRPHRLVVSGQWDIPIGSGRPSGSSLPLPLRLLASGWDVGWITTIASGQPVSGWGGAVVTRPLQEIDRTLDKWFDTGAFAAQPAFTLRSLSSNIAQIRTDSTRNFDFNLGRNIAVHETVSLRLHAQFLNLFNTPQFSAPNTSVTSTAFGSVSGQANQPRWIFVGAKILF